MRHRRTGTKCDAVVAAFACRAGIAGSELALDRSRQTFIPLSRRIGATLSPHPLKGTDPCRSASSQTLSVT
jgi:hypothetical protein